MSYILEAIKKAEQERGGTLLPNKPVNSTQQEENTSKSIPWIAIAIFINAVILCAWIVFQQLNKSSDQVESGDDVSGSIVIENEQVAEELQVQVQKENPISVDDNINSERMDEISNPEFLHEEDANHELNAQQQTEQETLNSEVPSFFSATPNQVDANNILEQPELIQEESPASSDIERIDINLSAENPEQIISKAVDVQRDQPEAFIDPLPVVEEPNEQTHSNTYEEPVVDTPPQQEVAIAVVENPNVPELGELPFSMQQQIPKIQISVHIYNVDKDARKVRINGGLFLEGDLVESDLVVEEITAHGVIFDYQGTLFKLSLR